jgi:L-aminopeptidase/D-esterase-like protein
VSSPQLLSAFAGHWTGAGTGVTVIIPPPGTIGSGEVRGGAPATREFALLDPVRLVDRVDAVVLSGGSAFGLAAGDGVMGLLRERGTGFATPLGPVPIVIGMSLFDGSVAGAPSDLPDKSDMSSELIDLLSLAGPPPGAESGRLAALAALGGGEFAVGAVGAGTGATTGKWRGRLDPGGLGVARGAAGAASVVAVAAVNSWGDVIGDDGRAVFAGPAGSPAAPVAFGNTTLGVLLTDAALTKTDCHLLAQSGHTGFARAIHPAHSRYDGDAVVSLATGEVSDGTDLDLLRAVAAEVMAAAIRKAVIRE